MNIQTVIATYRSPNPDDYPELAGYTREQIYEGCMGGGALYLAASMARKMDLEKGDLVLDLGCGQGASSIFLAERFGVQVVAVDLWISASALHEKLVERGYRNQILPLNMDIRDRLPFAEGYFDAIFCMNSLSFYGGSVEFMQHLIPHLRKGGQFCVGMETLSEEFSPEAFANPPSEYNYNLPPPDEDINVWESDFAKMHSPPWWAKLFRDSGLLAVTHCSELRDATVLYEDLVLYQIEHNLDPEDVQHSIAQLEYGREKKPRKSLFVITGTKL